MDNGQMPPVQPLPSAQPLRSMSPVQSSQSMPSVHVGSNGMSMIQQTQVVPSKKDDKSSLIKTIVIVILSLISVTFIGLFIWMSMQYSEMQGDIEGQIRRAVADAKVEQYQADQLEFQAVEKNPYKTFSGPADYGELTFKYPKTWSVYVASDASNGGDFSAYFNPGQVNAVSKDTVNALRVTIRNKSFESVVEEYQKAMEKKDSNLTVESIIVGDEEKGISATANRYNGKIPDTDLNGCIVVFKIRDKTVIMQTDSTYFVENGDFDNLLKTIEFNA